MFSMSAAELESLTLGGRKFLNLKNLLTLIGSAGPGAGTYNSSLRTLNNGGYQVPVGKTLRISVFGSSIQGGATVSSFGLGYSDNDVGMSSGTAYVNLVTSAGLGGGWQNLYTGYYGQNIYYAFDFLVPATKYVAMYSSGAANNYLFYAYGYLE